MEVTQEDREPNWHLVPAGEVHSLVPAEALAAKEAELAAERAKVAALEAEMARRDANENRNCINWGPCSRHDKRMSDPDYYRPVTLAETQPERTQP